jgi:hypothetical protein
MDRNFKEPLRTSEVASLWGLRMTAKHQILTSHRQLLLSTGLGGRRW